MRRRALAVGALLLAALPLTAAAAQSPDDAEVVVRVTNVGSISVAASDVACPGAEVGETAVTVGCRSGAWDAADFRGTGEGWHVTVSARGFVSDAGDSVAVSNLTVQLSSSEISRTDDGVPCPTDCPTSRVVSAQSMSAIGLTIVSADRGEGLGEFGFTPSFTLRIPPGTPSGTYTASMTATIVSGPG